MAVKVFRPEHSEPGPVIGDYLLLPYGYKYNSEYLTFKPGDCIKLFNGGKYEIDSVVKVELEKPYCDVLCRMRYGISIKRAMQIWKHNAVCKGYGNKAISDEECLLVRYKRNM